MQRLFKSPGLIPTFALGFSRATADNPPGLDTWRGMPGTIGFPNRWQFIDEAAPDDTDYISQGLGNVGSIYSAGLGLPPTAIETGIIFRVRARSMGGASPGTQTFNYDIIRTGFSFSSTGNVLTTSFGTLVHVFTVAEVAAFKAAAGNVAALVHGSGLGGAGNDAFEVSWLELEYD